MNKTYKKWAIQVHQLMKMLAMHDHKTYKEEILLLNKLPLCEERLYLRHLTKYELAVINAVRMQGIGYNLRQKMRQVLAIVMRAEHRQTPYPSSLQFQELLEETFLPKLPFNPHRWNKYVRMVHALNVRDNTVYFDTERYSGHESPLKENLKMKDRISEKLEQSRKRKRLNPPVRVRHERPNDDKFYIRNLYFHLDEKEQELVTAFQIDRQYQIYRSLARQEFERNWVDKDSGYSLVAAYLRRQDARLKYVNEAVPDPLPSFWRWKVTQDDAKRKLNKLSNRDCIAY